MPTIKSITDKLRRLSRAGDASPEFKREWTRFRPEWRLAQRAKSNSLTELALVVLDKLCDEELERKGLV